MDQLEQKMDGKLEHVENNVLESLNGRISKIDKVCEWNHENKGSIQVEQISNNNNFIGVFNSNGVVTYGCYPKGVNPPKFELRKFYGINVFTWMNQIEKYFQLHNIMYDNKMIHIATLNFEIKPCQWVVKIKTHYYDYTYGLFTK